MSLFYKQDLRQTSLFGLILSFIFYISILAVFIYNFASDKYTISEVIQSSYLNKLNPFDYPIMFSFKYMDTNEYLEDGSFDIKMFITIKGVGTIYDTSYPCSNVKDKYFKTFGEKMKPFLNSEIWDKYYCFLGLGGNITSNPLSSEMSMEVFFNLIPNQINEGRKIRLLINTIMDEIDTSKKDNNIFLKEQKYFVDLNIFTNYQINAFFTKNIFKVTGNAFRSSTGELNYYILDELIINKEENGLYEGMDPIGTYAVMNFNVNSKLPIKEKKYPSILDVLGLLGGWVNILSAVLNVIFFMFFSNFYKLNMIKSLTSNDEFDLTQVEGLNPSVYRFNIPKQKIMMIQNQENIFGINMQGDTNQNRNFLVGPNSLTLKSLKEHESNKKLLKIKKKMNYNIEESNLKIASDTPQIINFNSLSQSSPKNRQTKILKITIEKTFSLKDVIIRLYYYFIPFMCFINKKRNKNLKYVNSLVMSYLSMENVYRINREIEYLIKGKNSPEPQEIVIT